MKHIILMSLALTSLASCTLIWEKAIPTDTMKIPEAKMDPTMKKDAMMSGSIEMPIMDDTKMDDTMLSGSEMMKPDESQMMKPTGYMEYDAQKVTEALSAGQKVALFFHASWCPSCRALDKAITADVSSIPTDALIVKVDYDNSEDMKKKYGVTSQHTTVIVDADMALVSKKTGARTIADIWN